jgi:hypothetical protein
MDERRLQDALDRYGPDLAQWPERPRRQAQALLRRSPEARRRLDRAARLERALEQTLQPGRAPEGLAARIAAVPETGAHTLDAGAPPVRLRRLAWVLPAATAASLLLGVALGASGVLAPAEPEADGLAELAYGAADVWERP